MIRFNEKIPIFIFILYSFCFQTSKAGPPFFTDDPQHVDLKHWEFYIASVNTLHAGTWSGTSPHFEVNYGLIPNLQVHLLLPLNYNISLHREADFGFGNTEVGVKYCFIRETEDSPQLGIFPIVQIPTIKIPEFSNGEIQLFIPLWAQKSWGNITTYGGLGYGINPGVDNKSWIFTGWEIQYTFSPKIMLGGEIYYHSADAVGNDSSTAFNIGGAVNFTREFHFIFSLGHSLTNDNFLSSYIGLLWTI